MCFTYCLSLYFPLILSYIPYLPYPVTRFPVHCPLILAHVEVMNPRLTKLIPCRLRGREGGRANRNKIFMEENHVHQVIHSQRQ